MVTSELAKLASTVGRHTAGEGVYDTAAPGLTLYRSSVTSEHDSVVYEPSLVIVAQGSKEVLLAGEVYRYDPAHSLLVSVDLPVSARVVHASADQPCLVARVALDLAVVASLLADCAPAPPAGPAGRGLGVSPVDPQLLDAVNRFVALLDAPQDVVPLAPLRLREITYRVLTGAHGARLRQIAAAGAPSQRIARAIRWLKDHFGDPLRVESLARQVGMSPSSLHLHFKRMTGLSPVQYQKQLRLQEARRLMLVDRLEAAEAAFRVGYESPSQFGREYRRLFGAPPRRDVAAVEVGARPAGRAV